MRLAGAALVLWMSILLGSALWQNAAKAESTTLTIRVAEALEKAPSKKGPAKSPAKAAPKTKSADAPVPVPPGTYAAMPLAERAAIQFDLAWTNYYNGLITGDFSDRAIAAVRAFQKDNRFRETGVLAPPERAVLAASSKTKQEQAGWTMVDDRATGSQIGLPTKHVPNATPSRSGTRWASAQGQVQVETFRIREPGATLANVFEQQKKEPANRQTQVNLLRNDFFILNGTQGLKKFYVRAEVRDLEIRGFTLLYDQAIEGIMDPIAVVMSSAFAPFSGSGLASLLGPAPRRKIEYGTGVVVSTQGHVLTDAKLIEGCDILQVSGYGDANRQAEDGASGLALLRVYGSSAFKALPLAGDGRRASEISVIGIGDPQSQAGARLATVVPARLSGGDGIQPLPPIGFAGAAVVDNQNQFAGLVVLKGAVTANADPNTSPPPAAIVSADAVRQFLGSQAVIAATGSSTVDTVKAALVRIVCVRK